MAAINFQGPNKDFALHTIGWQAFQDLSASIAESEYSRTVSRVAKSSDEGRDGFFYGVPDQPIKANDSRQTTIQCKHFSKADDKLTLGKLASELDSIKKLVASGRAHGYILMTNANITEGDRKPILEALKKCGVTQPFLHGREWVVAKILEYPRVRALVPRVYGLGDLSWICDLKALEQAKAIIDSMGDDLACYVPTKAHRDAVGALDAHRVVLLLGDPAVGKSSIAAALSVSATDEDKCEVIYVRNPEEFVSTWNPDVEGRLFWIDDAFGSIQYTPELSDRWNKVFQTMKAAIKRKNRFIITSRTHIWQQARSELKVSAFPPLVDGRVVVDVEKLTLAEKERILYNHLKFGKQPHTFLAALKPFLDAIVESAFFRPEIARRLGNPAFTGAIIPNKVWVIEFFRFPARFLGETLSNLEPSMKAAIGLIFVKAGRLPSPLETDEATQLIANSFDVTLAQIKSALTTMKGSFVNCVTEDDETYWTYKHPTVADAFAIILGQHEELIEVYLRGTKITQILREVKFGSVSVQGSSVTVGSSQYDILLDRFDQEEDISETELRRFLVDRCGSKFFQAFLERYPDIMQWTGIISRPVHRDYRTRMVLKAHQFGVLSSELRAKFIDTLKEQVLNVDVAFLQTDSDVCKLLTSAEREEMLVLAKEDLLENLNSTIESETFAHTSFYDAEDWFQDIRNSIDDLEELFPDDDDVAYAVEEAREAIEESVRMIMSRADDDPSDEESDTHEQGSAAISSNGRSIFDDLVP